MMVEIAHNSSISLAPGQSESNFSHNLNSHRQISALKVIDSILVPRALLGVKFPYT